MLALWLFVLEGAEDGCMAERWNVESGDGGSVAIWVEGRGRRSYWCTAR
jgi:hypothetical protein